MEEGIYIYLRLAPSGALTNIQEVRVYSLPLETIQKTLDYLSTKPYIEVFELISGIQKATLIKEPDNSYDECTVAK